MPPRDSVEVAVVDSPDAIPRGEQRLMTRARLTLAVSTLFAAGLITPTVLQAQGLGVSSARDIPNEVQKAEPRVDQLIDKAEAYFKQGKLNLEDNKRDAARSDRPGSAGEAPTGDRQRRSGYRVPWRADPGSRTLRGPVAPLSSDEAGSRRRGRR